MLKIHSTTTGEAMNESINVAGVDTHGRLKVFVSNPKGINAVDRARMYQGAPEALKALRNAECIFWACPGPDEPFVGMATCWVCIAIKALTGQPTE